jgi:4-hydroxybenzoate polyprenyltransferase
MEGTVTTPSPRLFQSLVHLGRSARLTKLVPLVLVLLNAALLTGRALDARSCVLAIGFILAISVFGIRLNILTDVELDRRRKPQLIDWLTSSPHLLKASLVAELSLSLFLLAGAAARSALLAGGLLIYGAAFTLYSYNFITFWDPKRNRLKVFWWGNAGAVMSGYSALWIAGFACAPSSPGASGPWLVLIAAGAVLLDYGVFLNECAGDASEERSHGLKTLPALLGAHRTSLIALALSALGVAVVAAGAHQFLLSGRRRAAFALVFYVVVQALGCLGSLPFSTRPRRRGRWERLVDSAFWVSRGGALVLLLMS